MGQNPNGCSKTKIYYKAIKSYTFHIGNLVNDRNKYFVFRPKYWDTDKNSVEPNWRFGRNPVKMFQLKRDTLP